MEEKKKKMPFFGVGAVPDIFPCVSFFFFFALAFSAERDKESDRGHPRLVVIATACLRGLPMHY